MTTAKNATNIMVFVGGYDAEMVEIINICRKAGVEVVDHHLGWGANCGEYKTEIAEAIAAGKTPVLVELANDWTEGWGDNAVKYHYDIPAEAIVVDHHGTRCHEPASILQVLTLLGLEPSRQQLLIAANDAGYIPAMLSLGATAEEIASVRLADRSAQGISSQQEAEAEQAIAEAEVINGVTIIRLPHSKTATITDRLFNPEKEQRLLILSEDGELNFYGSSELCSRLEAKLKELGANYTYSGATYAGGGNGLDMEKAKEFILEYFSKKFINCTPHSIVLNDGRRFEPCGTIARVSQTISEFDENGIATQEFGKVEGLPEPQPNTIYIVSAMVLSRAQMEGRTDVVAPATGHKACVRDEAGRIVSVPGFLR